MRTLLVSAVSSIVAWVGFASTSSAAVTIDLDWFTGIGPDTDATISVGDTVRWTIFDFHTVTSSSGPTSFDSGLLIGGTYSYTFLEPGSWDYFCQIHGALSMGGTITVMAVDVCGDGMVTGGEACDDGNTSDGDCCSSTCQFEAPGSACDDGDACTSPDTCDGVGSCDPGPPFSCDDSNVCTTDSCNPASGCVYENAPPVGCDDGDACTTTDTCSGGSCQGGPAPDCDDGDVCTADGCDMITGCFNNQIQTPECALPIPASSEGGRVLLLAMIMLLAGFGLHLYPRSVKGS